MLHRTVSQGIPHHDHILVKQLRIIDSAIKALFNSSHEQDPKIRAITSDRIVATAATDEECQTLTEYIQSEFPESYHDLRVIICQFWSMCKELYCLEDVPIMDNKILILK